MQPLFEVAERQFAEAKRSEKRGLYFYASLKYAQIWSTLVGIVNLRDQGVIPLTPEEEARLGVMYELLVAGLYRVQAKMKNGRHLSGRQKNSPQDAVGMLIGDILQGL